MSPGQNHPITWLNDAPRRPGSVLGAGSFLLTPTPLGIVGSLAQQMREAFLETSFRMNVGLFHVITECHGHSGWEEMLWAASMQRISGEGHILQGGPAAGC